MTPILLLTLCLGIASAAPMFDPSLDAQWQEWKTKYGRRYFRTMELYKRAIWEKNMKIIEQHNKEYREGKHSYTLGMNAFGDMSLQEYNKMLTGLLSQNFKEGKVFQKTLLGDLPKSLDWSKRGYVTPVRDQGPCGSCWAFSANGALEGQIFRKTGKLVSLSVQNLVDCSRPQGNVACQGGLMPKAFKYIMDNGGLDTEESYPYEAREGPCRYRPEKSVVNITGFVRIPENEKALMNAVASVGPISVALDAHHVQFQFYKSGIYYNPNCSNIKLDHALLAVGYGFEGKESDGSKYWLIKNSWGTSWGMDGYLKLAKDRNNHCGVAKCASYPTL